MAQKIQVIIGPTASGKTAHAIKLAQQHGAVIINMDAMQIYRDLRIITARPSEEEEAAAEHRLYGMLDWDVHGNAAMWCDMAAREIEDVWAQNKLPLLVGGTGMYLKCLMEGLPHMPEISAETKEKVLAMSHSPLEGNDSSNSLYEELKRIDPTMAERLESGDTQRIQRALEVILETGESLDTWHAKPTTPFFADAEYTIHSLLPPREMVYDKINTRFAEMATSGAIEEVAALREKVNQTTGRSIKGADIYPANGTAIRKHAPPLLKAHGVPEIWMYLDGDMTLEDATAKAQQNTRNYAKRQMTWIRNQLPNAIPLTPEAK